jgi:hypothetical protein
VALAGRCGGSTGRRSTRGGASDSCGQNPQARRLSSPKVRARLDPSGPNSAPGPCPGEASRSGWQASCTRRCDLEVTAYWSVFHP